MHPVIRIGCFLILCIALARPDKEQLVLAAALLTGLFLTLSPSQWRRALGMIRRLRWLLLSVLVIYGWLTPGIPLQLPLPEYLLPTQAGLEAGLMRVLILILIVLGAGILLVTTSRQQLIAALYWLLAPLRWLKRDPQRLAVRLALTLDYVERQETLWRTPAPAPAEGPRERINRIAQHLATLLPRLFEQAEQPPPGEVQLDVLAPPPLIQWLWPVLLIAGFIAGALIDW